MLGLMVIVGALVVPNYRATLPSFKLRKSADVVRQAWTAARIKAMKTGQTYVFKFEVNGSKYKIEPWYGTNDYLEADLQGMVQGQGAGGASATSPVAGAAATAAGTAGTTGGSALLGNNQLPEGIVFQSMQGGTSMREGAMQAQDTSNLNIETDTNTQWSNPIVFYPDGTTSDSQITVNNKKNVQISIRIRGLTGAVQVSEFMAGGSTPAFSENQ